MTAYVFSSQVDALSFSGSVNTKVGFPKDSVDGGSGLHCSKVESRTANYGEVIPHPTLALWRYVNDGVVSKAIVQGTIVPATGAVQTLDATWFPAGAAIT